MRPLVGMESVQHTTTTNNGYWWNQLETLETSTKIFTLRAAIYGNRETYLTI